MTEPRLIRKFDELIEATAYVRLDAAKALQLSEPISEKILPIPEPLKTLANAILTRKSKDKDRIKKVAFTHYLGQWDLEINDLVETEVFIFMAADDVVQIDYLDIRVPTSDPRLFPNRVFAQLSRLFAAKFYLWLLVALLPNLSW
jgi:hypothetical protein